MYILALFEIVISCSWQTTVYKTVLIKTDKEISGITIFFNTCWNSFFECYYCIRIENIIVTLFSYQISRVNHGANYHFVAFFISRINKPINIFHKTQRWIQIRFKNYECAIGRTHVYFLMFLFLLCHSSNIFSQNVT